MLSNIIIINKYYVPSEKKVCRLKVFDFMYIRFVMKTLNKLFFGKFSMYDSPPFQDKMNSLFLISFEIRNIIQEVAFAVTRHIWMLRISLVNY